MKFWHTIIVLSFMLSLLLTACNIIDSVLPSQPVECELNTPINSSVC